MNCFINCRRFINDIAIVMPEGEYIFLLTNSTSTISVKETISYPHSWTWFLTKSASSSPLMEARSAPYSAHLSLAACQVLKSVINLKQYTPWSVENRLQNRGHTVGWIIYLKLMLYLKYFNFFFNKITETYAHHRKDGLSATLSNIQ